jgi:hypothetical protein
MRALAFEPSVLYISDVYLKLSPLIYPKARYIMLISWNFQDKLQAHYYKHVFFSSCRHTDNPFELCPKYDGLTCLDEDEDEDGIFGRSFTLNSEGLDSKMRGLYLRTIYKLLLATTNFTIGRQEE